MNTARVIQDEPEVKRLPIDDFITNHFGVHAWNPEVDKLAKDLPMPKELKAILRKSFWRESSWRKSRQTRGSVRQTLKCRFRSNHLIFVLSPRPKSKNLTSL
jgi:hypothetical protein